MWGFHRPILVLLDKKSTPLLEFLKEKRAEKYRIREEKREAKKKKKDEERKSKDQEKKAKRKEKRKEKFAESKESKEDRSSGCVTKEKKILQREKRPNSGEASENAEFKTKVFTNTTTKKEFGKGGKGPKNDKSKQKGQREGTPKEFRPFNPGEHRFEGNIYGWWLQWSSFGQSVSKFSPKRHHLFCWCSR